jgi:hypothetical protein
MTKTNKSKTAFLWGGSTIALGSLILLLVRALTGSPTLLGVLAHLVALALGLVLIWQYSRANRNPGAESNDSSFE